LIANPSVAESGVDVLVAVNVTGAAEPVKVGKGVVLGVSVATEGVGVRLATPIINGVGLNTEGVCVNGRNGVGGLPGRGWMIQPLHDASKIAARKNENTRFMFSPLSDCISDKVVGKAPEGLPTGFS